MTTPGDAKQKVTLLLSSAGRRVELMRLFREDAAELGIDLKIVTTDMDADWSPACRIADAYHAVPAADHPTFIERMLAIVEHHGVDLVLPTIDLELEPLARHMVDFRARGAKVMMSSPDLVRLARDKLKTAEILGEKGVPVPRSATPEAVSADPAAWPGPLMIKPRGGWSSLGLKKLERASDLALDELPDGCLVQEFLEGDEYTINLYFDQTEKLVCVIPHFRYEVRAGEVSKGVTRRVAAVEKLGRDFGAAIEGARGPLCIQAIVTSEGRIGMFEINARIGGGYPLAHAAGARFTRWMLEEAAGLPSSTNNDWRSGVTMLRYDAAVVVEDGS